MFGAYEALTAFNAYEAVVECEALTAFNAYEAVTAQLLVMLYNEPVIKLPLVPLVPAVPDTAELAATQLPVPLK